MTVRTYTWGLTVHCIKMVKRDDAGIAERYSGADRSIDLTPYLGEAGSVRTAKSLTDPAGTFEVSFGDWVEPGSEDTVYARVEPMDLIEIRAARSPADFQGADLPLIMRGFASAVRRTESMGADGQPRRAVVITGHDFGKLWLINHVYWELAVKLDKPMLTVFGLQAMTDMQPQLLGVADFVHQFTEKVMNQRIAEMEQFTTKTVKPFKVDATVTEGLVLPQVIGAINEATYWSVLTTFQDAPWNELFVEDQEDGPHVIFRPVPFKGIDGKLLFAADGAVDPGSVTVDIEEVVQLDVTRTDARVANFYWVPPGTASLLTNLFATSGAIQDGSAFDDQHGNNKPELYGTKKMQAQSALIPTDSAGEPAKVAPEKRQAEGEKFVQWHRARAKALQDMNRDNSVLEDGGLMVMGREDYKPGRYLRLTRGDLTSECYMQAVSHTFQPLVTWTTTVQFVRGNGFVERSKIQASPYLAERREGPYT